jgi:hypothetical protein
MSTPDGLREFCRYLDETRAEIFAERRRIADQLRKNNEALHEIIREPDARRGRAA